MTQLVSERLLIGPGTLLRGPHLMPVVVQARTSRRTMSSSTTNGSRALQSSFFAPAAVWNRSVDGALGQASLPLAAHRQPRSRHAVLFVDRIFGFSRRNQQHLAASAYAPPSDDPEITTTTTTTTIRIAGSATAAPLDPLQPQQLSPSQAIAAGYRPVPTLNLTTLPRLYRQLAKAQLSFLVTLTAMAGYALCPSSLAVSTSVTTLLSMTLGTALCSASANSLNQLVESPYDAQMPRTRNRPLPSRSVTPLHAASFASVAGIVGVGALATINPLTAALGLANIVLYAGVYTPMKRVSIVNTWVGSIVGGIPPLIGWTACTGTLHLASDLPGWTLAALLFAWQFPHFNSLAHTLRREYARGGYRMMSVTNPGLNRRTSFRYAVSLLPICSVLLPWTGVVHWMYAVLSAPLNAAMIYASYGFWRQDGDKAARQCFWTSLIHLPAVLLLAMACKTDVVEGVQRKLGLLEETQEDVDRARLV